jgi:hypothetical protein
MHTRFCSEELKGRIAWEAQTKMEEYKVDLKEIGDGWRGSLD